MPTAVSNALVVVAITIAIAIVASVAMHFKFLVRKVLVALGYPKFETVHPELGAYEVGAIKIRLSPDFPPCQLFYPVETKTTTKTTKMTNRNKKHKKNTFAPYYRPQSVKGLVKFLHNGDTVDGLIQMLQDAPHPLSDNYGADPLPAPTSNTKNNNTNTNNNNTNNNNNNKNNNTNTNKFPLVFFSHGLGGSMEMYTELCSQLASLGCIVVAPEHADTSASYSSKVTADGTVEEVWYKPPLPDSIEPYSRKKMVNYRGPHLEDRVDELTALYYGFLKNKMTPTPLTSNSSNGNDNGNGNGNDSEAEAVISITNQILAAVDPLQLHLVGHSFGGATQLLAAQRWATERCNRKSHNGSNSHNGSSNSNGSNSHNGSSNNSHNGNSKRTTSDPPIVPLSITVFDAWNFALSDAILARGIPSVDNNDNDNENDNDNDNDNDNGSSGPPILSILSEEWALTNPEREQLMVFLRNSRKSCKRIDSYYAMHSVHQSVSDTEAWLPTIASKAFENRGPLEDLHVTIRAVTSAFARHSGMVVATPSSDADTDTDTDTDNTTIASSVSTGGTLVPFPIKSYSSSSESPK